MIISYAYVRVSTSEQCVDRQVIAIKNFRPNISDGNIFIDQASGKDFNRESYKTLKIILENVCKINSINNNQNTIEVVIEEMDRLGRNNIAIRDELNWFLSNNIKIRILEIPTTLTDVEQSNEWVMLLINKIIIEVYSSIAQHELEKRSKRQYEGIAIAKSKGVYKGRPATKIDNELFEKTYKRWKKKEISGVKAMEVLSIKKNTFYRRVKEKEFESKQ